MMKRMAFLALTSMMVLPACGAEDDYDPELLEEYRAAIPSMTQVAARAPAASTFAALGDPAVYPQGSYDVVLGVNGAIGDIIATMRFLVMQEPTVYNTATQEFLWGPYDSDDGIGTVAAYIRDAGPLDDFRYHYVLLRGMDNNIAGMTPVIWGGATPNPGNDDHGAGITMWDFEAAYEFAMANDPNAGDMTRGRFIAVYGSGPGENNDEVTIAVAAFRNFIPEDNPGAEPADLDYLYGRVDAADGNSLDFVDFTLNADIDDDPARPAAEDLGVRMAFLNEGMGRAEATATNGDFEPGQVADVVECWDTSINQSYIHFMASTNGVPDFDVMDGDIASCGLFQDDLSTLGVPSLQDVDVVLLDALDQVAQNGIPN